MKLGEVFTDPNVARAYRYRPEYPPDTFRILSDLIVGPPTVLDVGAGTGAIARGMVPFVDRVDAVDISTAMIDEVNGTVGSHGVAMAATMGLAALDEYVIITAGLLGLRVYHVQELGP